MVLFIIAVDGRHLFFVFCFFFLAGFTEVVGLSPLIFATALGFFFATTSGNNSHCDKEIYSRVVENVVLV